MINIVTRKRLYRLLVGLFVISLLFFVSSLVYYYLRTHKDQVSGQDQFSSEPAIEMTLKQAPMPQEAHNILFLGHGDPGHPGGDLADTLILAHINTTKKLVALISVPRDTWLSVNLGEGKIEPHKINEVYLVGKNFEGEEFGFQLIKQALSEVLGLPVHNYVFISFGKFMEAIDGLGGISVEVPVTFDDYYYPVRGRELEICGWLPEDVAVMTATMSGFQLEKQFSCRYEHLHFSKGKTEMDGETALKFVRSRHSDQHGGDFARSQRQQAVILGIAQKLFSLRVIDKVDDFFRQLSSLVKSDLDLEAVKALADLAGNPDEYRVVNLVLSDENVFDASRNKSGQFVLIPKAGLNQWTQIQKLVESQLEFVE